MSSKELARADFADSVKDALLPFAEAEAFRPLSRNGIVRPLSRSEVDERNQSTVDFFRATQAINTSDRSIQETEALLAAARNRQSKGPSARVRSKSKPESTTDVIDKAAAKAETSAPTQIEGQRKKCVDLATLWGAPPAKLKPPVEPSLRKSIRRSIHGEGVAVGDGSNSLRERMLSRVAARE
jgi:hypothetical protein